MSSRKLLTGGLTLALLLGGAIYAYAQDSTSGTVPDDSSAKQQQVSKSSDQGNGYPWMGHSGQNDKKPDKMNRMGEPLSQLSGILGMSTDDIKAQLKAGKSIADLAKAKGIAEQDLINRLVASASQKVDNAVKAGKLTQEKADQIKKNLPDRIKKLVERKGLPDWHGHDRRPGLGMMPKLETMAGWFKMTKEDLAAQLKAGKTLADIASQHGMTKDQLISKIQDELKPRIDKFVSSPLHQDSKDGRASDKGTTAPAPSTSLTAG